jgi:hypothetical protein
VLNANSENPVRSFATKTAEVERSVHKRMRSHEVLRQTFIYSYQQALGKSPVMFLETQHCR